MFCPWMSDSTPRESKTSDGTPPSSVDFCFSSRAVYSHTSALMTSYASSIDLTGDLGSTSNARKYDSGLRLLEIWYHWRDRWPSCESSRACNQAHRGQRPFRDWGECQCRTIQPLSCLRSR